MKLLALFFPFLGLLTFTPHMTIAQVDQELYASFPYIPELINHTSDEQDPPYSAEDELELVWKENPNVPSPVASEDIRLIKAGHIRLLAQLDVGAPTKLFELNQGNNPRILSTRFRIKDFEHLLAKYNTGTYGNEWKSGTPLYLHIDHLRIVNSSGKIRVLELTGRQQYIRFDLK